MEREQYRSKEAKKITLFGFWVNSILTVCKIYAGIIGKSSAMVADGIHSLSDFLTDVIVLVGFKFSEQPEDECHNYGHDKYETLATTLISIFLVIVGFEILKSGIRNIILVFQGELLPQPKMIALVAAIISIATKEFLYHYTVAAGKRMNSSAITANAWHHRSDALSSIGTLIGIGGAILLGDQWTILDPIASVVVSILIFKVAMEILLPAINELMESALCEEEKEKIEIVLNNCKDIKGYHRLRTRKLGTKVIIELHILVDEGLNIRLAHQIATTIENEIKDIFGNISIITIHIEPFEEKKI